MTVQRVAGYVALPHELTEDMLCWACMLLGMGADLFTPTPPELKDGWSEVTCRSGHVNKFAVGWRLEKMQREATAKREAEMAACPYVACQCGYHEQDY